MAIFYCKEGHPLGEITNRLIVGIGTVTKIGKILRYKAAGKQGHPLWDRLIHHSIRPTGTEGFLLPYHDYVEPMEDQEEWARRLELLNEIAFAPADAPRFAVAIVVEHAGHGSQHAAPIAKTVLEAALQE